MLPPSWLWIPFTLIAAASQTARNAMQRDLVDRIGAAGATYVRFIFGLPFAILFLAAQRLISGEAIPVPGARALAWCVVGMGAQMIATALMLIAMKTRSFVLVTALTKTEPVLVAIFSILFLAEIPAPLVALAIAIATSGVLLMSAPKGGARVDGGARSALIGLASAATFGLSATGYRGTILSMPQASFYMTATTVLVMGLAMQSAAILAWLGLRDRPLLGAIFGEWRQSILAGFMGALGSQFWYLGFAVASPALVRTLALVEVFFAQFVTRGIRREPLRAIEIAGMGLIVIGVTALLAA
jgi:drug/metabolite transporter (DMT)-like permease